jgi:hypothetical protein
MTRATCHAFLGLGCMASTASPVRAAEWSIAPTFTLGVNDNSNFALSSPATPAENSWLFSNVQFQRATETTQLSITPQFEWQHFDTKYFGNIASRDLSGAFVWTQERGSLNLTASRFDDSTLTTELTETGIASSDLNRLTEQASVTWTYALSQLRAFVLQASYIDVSYYGRASGFYSLLEGYKYPTASAGEQFVLSERTTLTATAFGDELIAPLTFNDSHEEGGQVQLTHNFSERTQLSVTGGGSARSLEVLGIAPGAREPSIEDERSTGTIAIVSFSHSSELGNVGLNYSRQLTPYGTGVLAQRQQITLSGTYNITEKVDVGASVLRIDNSQSVVLLHLDRRSYTGLTFGLDWRPLETWKLRLEGETTRTQAFETVSIPVTQWRVTLSLTWTPYPLMTSF